MLTEVLQQSRYTTFEKIATSVFAASHEASVAVAREIADLIRYKDKRKERTILGLATGATPKKVYRQLIRLHKEEGLSFENVVTFNLDEYYPIAPDALQSYQYFMNENLFDHIDIHKEYCFFPGGQTDPDAVKHHSERYEKIIEGFGGIDLQLLGIGRNGHIGFNEPGSNVHSVTRLITLDPLTRSDVAYHFGQLALVPRKAITMGVSTILKARRIILMAWGEGKAAIIKKAVEGPVTEFIPASYLQCHLNVEVILDEAAASDLTRKKAPWLTDDVKWDCGMIKKAVIHLATAIGKPILMLTDADYNENGLSDLLNRYGQAYDLNIEVFNWLQHTITGWPGGKSGADDSRRPERAEPSKKRVLIFSPHPDDDIISMGGTFQRLVDQGHEVHVAYQTSGNIAVADDEALRFIEFVKDFNAQFQVQNEQTEKIYQDALDFLIRKNNGQKDSLALRNVKGLIRKGEARNTCRFVGIPPGRIYFLSLPFYETGTIEKRPVGQEDIAIISEVIGKIQPHQIYAAGDLADPHGTHKVCLDAIIAAVESLKAKPFMYDCWIWLYKGAWEEWDMDLIEMAVPMSPDQVLKKRYGIFKHQSQKDGVVFQGNDNREFWQRAEDRNRATAEKYNQLGLAEYAAMEAFKRLHLTA